jgi:hypothetical protein
MNKNVIIRNSVDETNKTKQLQYKSKIKNMTFLYLMHDGFDWIGQQALLQSKECLLLSCCCRSFCSSAFFS